jgi:hypothetical protein
MLRSEYRLIYLFFANPGVLFDGMGAFRDWVGQALVFPNFPPYVLPAYTRQ